MRALPAVSGAVLMLVAMPPAQAQVPSPPEEQMPEQLPTEEQSNRTQAAAGSGWVFGGALTVHAQSEFTHSGRTPGTGVSAALQPQVALPSRGGLRSNTFVDTDLQLFANYSSWLSFNTDIKLERTRWHNANSYYADASNFLNNEAISLRQAYVTLRPTDSLSVYGGKIHPAFGSAYERTPGNFYSFATDYEQDERIGFGAEYRLPDAIGVDDLRLSFEIFYLDTSFFSNTLLSRPGLDDPLADRPRRFTRGQFGPSNTGALNSYTIALRGGQQGNGLSYQLSYTSQATSDPDGRTSHGVSVAARYDSIPLTSRVGLVPFLEYAWIDNFNSIDGLTRHYVVGGLTFTRGRWELAVAGGARISRGIGNATDHQQNVSLNYALSDGLSVGGGVNHITIAGRDSWTFGPSLTYELGL